ncbi:DNA/RNA non-specific endonuclease [Rhodococcus tukisamuensis]|uniref:Endonuclease G n=1 Tax=Rhodococcus tukisamuensis TaxID=168276 RepID=A0A1G6RET2_9NOCA|nr:DNA/RNA non-specific endonuclease [Rhodococcus tukisamuensis]SDD02893.1 endonuclease G [Rhodococcus tukisamuensis]
MTIVTPRPGHQGEQEIGSATGRTGTFESERQRQGEAAAQRARERAPQRGEHVSVLSGPGGVAAADTPERIAKRLDRLSRYYAGEELSAQPMADPPEAVVEEALNRISDVVDVDGSPEVVLEKIINTADFVGARYLDAGVAASRAVCRVVIRDGRGIDQGFGTGSLVSPTLMLTNHHVLPDADTARNSVIEFNFQDGVDGRELPRQTFPLDPGGFFVADRERDFALVAVRGRPELLAPFGFNRLIESEGKAIIGDFVTIVQHPRGAKKQIALRENRIVDIPDRFLHYSADTEPGSSGSPAFNDQWEVVALHHASVRAPAHTEFGGVLNEGVRISRILQHLRGLDLPPAWRSLVDQAFAVDQVERQTPAVDLPTPATEWRRQTSREGEVTVQIPLEITVRVGASGGGSSPSVTGGSPPFAVVGSSRAAGPEPEAISIDPDYRNRGGYDAGFLGVPLPLPEHGGALEAVASPELRYHHFSVVMHRTRALALFTAVNIDGKQSQDLRRESDRWILDPRLPANQQTGEAVYKENPLDRGHLVRRLDPAWGPAAKAANDDTFHFTNCTPQHHDFNAGSTLWLGLEDYILNNTDNADLAVSVVSGPVLAADDPRYRGVLLPRQFWKTVAMVKQDGELSVTGYLLSQAALLEEFAEGEEAFSFGAYRTFQVPVRRIAALTGLGLDAYLAADPLEHIEASGLPRELIRPQDLLL